MLIRSGDLVEVRSGNSRGTRAKVVSVQPENGKILVEGVNRVYRHMKRSQKNPQGGRLSKELAIDASNVLLVCGSCSKPTRIGVRISADGGKVRICKKCSAELGVLRSPRAAKAVASQ
ncbi:MAG: 50S ribosomal protein L24 [Planctomycetota bacterium]|jgi:large subunit ribosomal protein L24|nr:50S ribosomal protein L24 [Planctomycetia bacterium]RLS67772.1 MAG: 50S ribosomal protein L24 [Planctomycetota bacterium]